MSCLDSPANTMVTTRITSFNVKLVVDEQTSAAGAELLIDITGGMSNMKRIIEAIEDKLIDLPEPIWELLYAFVIMIWVAIPTALLTLLMYGTMHLVRLV